MIARQIKLAPTNALCVVVATAGLMTAEVATAAAAELVDAGSPSCGGSKSALVKAALDMLSTAQRHTTEWDGPKTGPKALPDKLVVYVAQDMRNGGVLGVSEGVQSAASAIGWRLKIIDGAGTVAGRVAAINQAVALKPDGIVLGSVRFAGGGEGDPRRRGAGRQDCRVAFHRVVGPGQRPANLYQCHDRRDRRCESRRGLCSAIH